VVVPPHHDSPTPNRPSPRGALQCYLRPSPGRVRGDVSVIEPLASTYVAHAAATPGSAALRRDRDKRTAYFRDHDCPGYHFRPLSFESLGRYSPGAMQFLREAAHNAFPGAAAGRVRGRSLDNIYKQLSVLNCRYSSRMLTAAAGLSFARTGRGWMSGLVVPSADLFE